MANVPVSATFSNGIPNAVNSFECRQQYRTLLSLILGFHENVFLLRQDIRLTLVLLFNFAHRLCLLSLNKEAC